MTLSNQICIDYNAQAVGLVADCEYAEAANMLKAALQNLHAKGERPNLTYIHSTTGTRDVHSVRLMSKEEAHRLSPNNLFQLYPCAFVMDPGRSHEISETTLSMVLLYNLGLATQLAALTTHRQDDLVMRHAIDVYGNVTSLIHQTFSSNRKVAQQGGDLVWLLLAMACNTGHIHSHRLDFCNTRQTLSWLKGLICLPMARLSVPSEDFRLFIENVCTFLEGRNLSLAPAA
ncbi:expressed unknown protein [Seminavis robusta]|uniref:Uncharacterized protein n=1 Tax=Seminavis robusta TaxID=568900 RepID=A0A9N8E848_9STRA|nr:expressed unknown protein [Seminavis robusta]|eukprot:Sro724_g193210.1 n/a (231) ;mRNA; r:40956-41648